MNRKPRRRFLRRSYHGAGDLLEDLRAVWNDRLLLRRAMKELIPAAFRERLMMVVTEVNGCRYCSYVHARAALAAGVSQEELRSLLGGKLPLDTPAEELAALVYAQHWADSGAHPDAEAIRLLSDTYGPEKAQAIHLVLRMIRIGNLLGNNLDLLLHRLTFGLAGLRRDEDRFAPSPPGY